MAKQNVQNEQQTMEDYLLSKLEQKVILKDGTTLKDVNDGHELTMQEAIAINILNKAMKGDIKAAQYIQTIQLSAQLQKKNK